MQEFPIPKPPKRESSKSKGGKQRRGDPAWKRVERDSARWLQEHAGVDPDPPVPPSSTGRVGFYTGLRYDLTSARYIGEVKRRSLPVWIHEAWVQVVQCALDRGNRHPVLVMEYVDKQKRFQYNNKQVKVPPMHVITAERHAELLRYESMIRGDGVSNITKDDIIDLIESTDD